MAKIESYQKMALRKKFRIYLQMYIKKPDVHFLDAEKALAPYRRRIKRRIFMAYAIARQYIPIGNVDVVVQRYPQMTIPEIGIGGYSPAYDLTFIYVDPANHRFTASLDRELMPIVAHELLHCVRWRGPGYGLTLGEALVSEGLALNLEALLRGQTPWYAATLTDSELQSIEAEAREDWESTTFNRYAWFVGSELQAQNTYKGYSLGYRLVRRKMESQELGINELWDKPAHFFL